MASPGDDQRMSIHIPRHEVADLMQCQICLCRCTLQRMLPCGHTFCQKCLQKQLDTKRSQLMPCECPVCRERPHIPVNGAGSFPCNFLINTLLEGQSRRSKCEKHPALDTDMFCKTCNHPICLRCCITGHNAHQYDDIENHTTKIHQRLLSLSSDADNHRDRLTNVQSELQEMLHCIQKDTEHAINRVKESSKDAIQLIHEREKQLIKDIESQRIESERQVKMCLNDLSTKISSCTESLKKCSDKLQEPLAMAQGTFELEQELQQQLSKPVESVKWSSSVRNVKAVSSVESLGRILLESTEKDLTRKTSHARGEKSMEFQPQCTQFITGLVTTAA